MTRRKIIVFIGIITLLIFAFIGGVLFQRYDGFKILLDNSNSVAPTPPQDDVTPPFLSAIQKAFDLDANQPYTLEQLADARSDQLFDQDATWLGEQHDEEACNALAEWDLDYDLDTWDEQLEPYYTDFLVDGLGGTIEAQGNIQVIFHEQVHETETYTVDYLVINTRIPTTVAHAYLMVPKAPPPDENGYPAMILLHANNNHIEAVAGLYEDKDRTNAGGVRWVEKGAVVLVVSVNDSRIEDMMRTARLVERNGYFLVLQRVHSMIDWLTQQTDIPIHRIATYGISFGGYVSFWTGITDERVDVVAANGFARDFTQWIFTNPTTAPHPMLRGWFEYMDWCRWETSTQARFIAPRRLLLEVGNRDKSTLIGDFSNPRTAPEPVDSTVFDIMAERIQDVYDALGIGERFKAVKFDGGHEMISIESEDWIYEQLTRPADMP